MEVKQIKCGKVRDGFDALTTLCEKEAQKLVSFWTKDFPELIGVGRFTSDENRNITFVLDYSESTL